MADALDFPPGKLLIFHHALALKSRLERMEAVARLQQFQQGGGTALLCSFDEELLAEVADEIWWVEGETLQARGGPAEVLHAYRADAAHKLRQSGNGKAVALSRRFRRGDGRATISGIELLGENGTPTSVWNSGELAVIRISIQFHGHVEDPVAGIMIRSRIGLHVYGTNTELERLRFGPCRTGETVTVSFGFRCELCPGEYTLTAASHDPDGVWHEWLEDAVAFTVADVRYTAGVANLRATARVEKT